MNLSVLKQLNTESVDVDIRLVNLNQTGQEMESERFGDVEFCGKKS